MTWNHVVSSPDFVMEFLIVQTSVMRPPATIALLAVSTALPQKLVSSGIHSVMAMRTVLMAVMRGDAVSIFVKAFIFFHINNFIKHYYYYTYIILSYTQLFKCLVINILVS